MWEWILGFIVSIVIALLTLFKYLAGNKDYWTKQNVHFLNLNVIASFWERLTFKVPFHVLDLRMYQAFKNSGCRTFGGIVTMRSPSLVIIDPDLIRAITVKDFDHFVNRRTFDMSKSDPLFHDMLINKESQEWKDLRSTLSPTFTTGKIKRMFEVFNESGDKLAKFLDQESAKTGEGGIDLRDALTRYTLDVISSAAFGFDSNVFNDENSPFSAMAKRVQSQFKGFGVIKLIIAMFLPKLLQWFRISITDKNAVDFFAGVIQETIRRRELSGEKRDDFIQLLLEAKSGELKPDETEKLDAFDRDSQLSAKTTKKMPLTDQLILSQALLFFTAGFDTTETLMIFAVYEMALNPECQDQLYQEIEEEMARSGGKLTYEAINRMEYLEMVISETLRKYPPAIRTERKCTQDYKLPNSDHVVKKGSYVVFPMYGIHYDEEYYPEPDRFDPERFSTENKASRHPYAYFPFGTGPRNCIAMRFALIEGKAALAHLIHNFKFEPSQKTSIPPTFKQAIGFKPDGMWLKVTRREQNEK